MAISQALSTLVRSPLDSARFGLEVYRGHIPADRVSGLWEEIVSVAADIAIFRVPAHDISAMRHYTGPRNSLIHADTLVYYDCPLDASALTPLGREIHQYRVATASDEAELRAVTEQVFEHYQNHYHANPNFDASDILSGYAEWAAGHLQPHRQVRTWVATENDRIVGFICCTFDERQKTAEIVLNGVLRAHGGKGVYADLVRLAKQHFAEMGLASIRVSTQVGNYAVQRVWNREAFRLVEAYDTWHANAFLTSDARKSK